MGILMLENVETINQHFVTSGWSLSYIISMMHGHMNIKHLILLHCYAASFICFVYYASAPAPWSTVLLEKLTGL
jgi:hypothetical protein